MPRRRTRGSVPGRFDPLALPALPLWLRQRVAPGRIPALWLVRESARDAVLASPRLLAYFARLGDSPAGAPDLKEFSKENGPTDPNVLKRLFRDRVGVSRRLFGWIWWLVCAADLVERTTDSPKAIALKVGVSSHAHLLRAFRAQFGETPAGVRRTPQSACSLLSARDVPHSNRSLSHSNVLRLADWRSRA